MGLLHFQAGNRRYAFELDNHESKRGTELPVEELHAIYLESNGAHPSGKHAKYQLEDNLNYLHTFWAGDSRMQLFKGPVRRVKEIIARAKQNGTEIWLGDLELTQKEEDSLAGPLVQVLPALWLARKGNADRRRISKTITTLGGKITPGAIRDLASAAKIRFLAKKTDHKEIGIFAGAGHVGIAQQLQKTKVLTTGQRTTLAERGSDALKMYRCIYDQQAKRWKVEEHSL